MDFYTFLDEDTEDTDEEDKNIIKPQPVQIPPKKKYFKIF